jgi:hypothetical protein
MTIKNVDGGKAKLLLFRKTQRSGMQGLTSERQVNDALCATSEPQSVSRFVALYDAHLSAHSLEPATRGEIERCIEEQHERAAQLHERIAQLESQLYQARAYVDGAIGGAAHSILSVLLDLDSR